METWLNADFIDAEFFDPSLYQVYLKDRDAVKTGCLRGGGVLIAVKRILRSSIHTLKIDDSLLDQLCISVYGY